MHIYDGMTTPALLTREMHWIGVVLAMAGLIVGLAACGPDGSDVSEQDNPRMATLPDSLTVTRVLQTDDRFSTLVAALDSTGLDSTLAEEGPYTLFAPTNEAFQELPAGTMEVLLGERHDRLRGILAHHIVEGRVSTAVQPDSVEVTMMSGERLVLHETSSGVVIGEARVVDGDIEVANGLIHVIERVLPPPSEMPAP